MAHRIINSQSDLASLIRFFGTLKLPFTVEWVPGNNRSLQQNRLQFLWAREVADQRGDMTADEVRCDWKLRHGVPILREESIEFCEVYDATLKPLPYATKLLAIQFIEVTSLMKVPQMIRYLDTVQRECLESGLRLTEPDPELAAYQARYREKPREQAA